MAAKIARMTGQVALAAGAAVIVCGVSVLALLVTLICAAPLKRLQAP